MGRAVLRRGPRPRPGDVRAGRTGLTPSEESGSPWRGPLSRYRGAPLATRAHVGVRWLSCPFPIVEREVPAAGRVLDVGTGHGLFALHLAERSPARRVLGVDIDEAKLSVARAAAARTPRLTNVSFSAGPNLGNVDGDFDAITVLDVLYLLEPDHQQRLVAQLAERLLPGGRLVVKESAETPRWKLRWSRAEEVLATKVLRITESTDSGLPFTAPAALAAWMAEAGLTVAERAIDRHYPYPHYLVVGTRPR